MESSIRTVSSGSHESIIDDDMNLAPPPAADNINNFSNMSSAVNMIGPDVPSSEVVGVSATLDEQALDDDVFPANVEEEEIVGEDDDSDYSYEDDDDEGYVASFLQASGTAEASSFSGAAAPATIEDEPLAAATSTASRPASKWREPTRAAVQMSLRAQQETKGGKRRLASDLYRIMNQDTHEAGFSLEPTREDSMEEWTIKLFQFDEDSNLAKDMLVLNIHAVELHMSFPENYPFEPPFVRVACPRFKKQTGFVMNGALCMELLTKDGWNPVNDIESVIVSIRSLLVVGDGRLEAAERLSDETYLARLHKAQAAQRQNDAKPATDEGATKRQRVNSAGDDDAGKPKNDLDDDDEAFAALGKRAAGSYSATEAEQAYNHLSDYHQKKGWDASGYWAKRG